YSSIYSYFLILVLLVTLVSLLVRHVRRAEDLSLLWFKVFVVVVVSQFSLSLNPDDNSRLFFAVFFTVMLPAAFFRTLFATAQIRAKALAFGMAFILMAATRLTSLLASMWRDFGAINGHIDWLAGSVADAGGVAYFAGIARLEDSLSLLLANLFTGGSWNIIALAAADTAMDAVTFALLGASVIFLGIWLPRRRKEAEISMLEAREQERMEQEQLEAQREERAREEQGRLRKAAELVSAAQSGDTRAQHELGTLFLCAQSYGQALPMLQAAADGGNTESSFTLGKLYLHGADGLAADTPKARAMLEAAARADHVEAQFLLGNMYFSPADGNTPDYAMASLWWGKAAAGDHTEAVNRLAQLHTMTDEFPEADALLAIKLLKKLAYEQGLSKTGIPPDMLSYGTQDDGEAGKPLDRQSKRARADDIKAEMYWLNESVKAKSKFLEDFADDWDWRNDTTQKKMNEDLQKIETLKTELEQLSKRKIV
ncbi:MAG: sel1 repeat family protein, partial [Defluviitaleaceae bacterium]|nr:sel1 repeat family protein [Defluviitaleaceae bacterium]